MYHPEYGKALVLLQQIHERYRPTINVNTKDVRLAIYYLAGGCVTQANLALRAWAGGDLNSPMRIKRFIDESKLLITCLIVVPDRDRFVRRFFKDEIVTIDPRNYKKDIMKATGMGEAMFKQWFKVSQKISHGFSKGVHPNLSAVAYNSDLDTAEFDYEAKNFAYYPVEGFDFANFIIIPAIDAVTLPSEVFGVSSAELSDIYEIREKIQKIAIARHEVRKARRDGPKEQV